MKIFNWIHACQFSRNVHSSNVPLNRDGSSGQIRRQGPTISKDINAGEKKSLLKQDVNVGQRWEFEGILSIGTLAIDPLKTNNLHHEDPDHFKVKESYISNCYDNHDDKISEAFLQDSHFEIMTHNLDPQEERDAEMKCNKEMDGRCEEIVQEKTTSVEKRVTLLDLFLADQLEETTNLEAAKRGNGDEYDYVEKANVSSKKMALFYTKLRGGKKGKKMAPNDGNEGDPSPRPMKKMQRFVTRIMKKKIHPDMEARVQKKVQPKLNDDVPLGGIDIHVLGLNAYASLLPIHQDIRA